MSTNLRLSDELADALRRASAERGQSQQEIVRRALATELGMSERSTPMEQAIRSGLVRPATPFQDFAASIRLAGGVTTTDLLDREDR